MLETVPILGVTNFTPLDWGVVLAYFVITTIIGARLAGKQSTIRDFFLGGRRLPWPAVSGSIIATEISAVTFVSVPFVVFRTGGDFTYLQLGLIGSLLARIIVGYVLVPAYYRKEIFSPYDYMGNQLGTSVRSVTTGLFTFGGILAQSARVYLTAIVLELILKDSLFGPLEATTGISSLVWAIWSIGLIAVIWTLLGGISTVIWTDVILFMVFVVGALTALLVVVYKLPGGFGEILNVGEAAGKFRFFDGDMDPTRTYTIWTAAIASTWFGVGMYGTDQLMAQRMFCCKNESDARKAIIFSFAGQGVTALVMLVGVALFAWYGTYPLEGQALALYEENPERIFPLFIIDVIPAGLTGLIIAGIFAAAVSSLDSILAALSQTTLSALYLPGRNRRLAAQGLSPDSPEEQRHLVRVSRILIVIGGIVLCLMAQLAVKIHDYYPSLLDLALALAAYTAGGLLAGFLLAFLPLKVDGYGFLWSAPLSVLLVFAIVWHQEWATWVCVIVGSLLLLSWIGVSLRRSERPSNLPAKTLLFAAAAALVVLVNLYGTFDRPGPDGTVIAANLAFPWCAPAGSIMAFVLGYLLANRRSSSES